MKLHRVGGILIYLLAWKVHYHSIGKGVFRAPKIPITAGRDLNAMSDALVKQEEDFVHNKASKLNPNGDKSRQQVDGVVDPAKLAANREAAGTNVSIPDGAPYMDGVSQQSGVPNDQGPPDNSHNPSFLHKTISGASSVNKKVAGSAHDVAHGFVGNLPGGDSVSQAAHGFVNNFNSELSGGNYGGCEQR